MPTLPALPCFALPACLSCPPFRPCSCSLLQLNAMKSKGMTLTLKDGTTKAGGKGGRGGGRGSGGRGAKASGGRGGGRGRGKK